MLLGFRLELDEKLKLCGRWVIESRLLFNEIKAISTARFRGDKVGGTVHGSGGARRVGRGAVSNNRQSTAAAPRRVIPTAPERYSHVKQSMHSGSKLLRYQNHDGQSK